MNYQNHPLYDWLVDFRRDLHMHPELAFSENRTHKKVKQALVEFGLEPKEIPGMDTGLTAFVKGGKPGPTLLVRADMDALPLTEMCESAYKSQNHGCMHACGHDAHTTIMLGVARSVVESGLIDELGGNLLFLFQPAEEVVQGANRMIKSGALKGYSIDRCVACHVSPDYPVGRIGLFKGVSHAAANPFELTITGKGAHGAQPQAGIDPIVAASHLIASMQTIISRNLSPQESGVMTIGCFQAGHTGNIIPEKARLKGTMRSLDDQVRNLLMTRFDQLLSGLRDSFQIEAELNYQPGVPNCLNDKDFTEMVCAAAAKVVGEDQVEYLPPSMGSEDFGLFLQHAPGSFIQLGCGNQEQGKIHPLHSPHFDMDEDVLPVGLEVVLQVVKDYLG